MISSPGLGSNLDVNNIVTQLMALESLPLNALAQQEGKFQLRLSALAQIKSFLATFETAAKGLTSATQEDIYSTSVADTSILTASASSTASEATHSITVTQLAASQALVAAGQTDATAKIGKDNDTTVTIEYGTISGGTFDSSTGTYNGASFTNNTAKTALTIDLNGTNNTLEGIRDAINALGADVTASIVNDGGAAPYRLSIVNSDIGVDNSLKITVNGENDIESLLAYDPAKDNGQNLAQTQAAADASFSLDGIAITRPDNSTSDVITGVTLNLKAIGSTTVSISRDTSEIRGALEALAKNFNEVNSGVAEATGLKAILQGDRAPIYVQNRLRAALSEAKLGISDHFSTLSQLGLSFQRDGSLLFDNSKLQSALETSVTDVRALVSAFGGSLSTLTDQLTDVNGPLNSRTDGINRSIADINDRREVLGRRLAATEIRLRAQFTALDTLIAGMLATSTYLEQQLANLPKITAQNR